MGSATSECNNDQQKVVLTLTVKNDNAGQCHENLIESNGKSNRKDRNEL